MSLGDRLEKRLSFGEKDKMIAGIKNMMKCYNITINDLRKTKIKRRNREI